MHRARTGYRDVTESQDPVVKEARQAFAEILATLPTPKPNPGSDWPPEATLIFTTTTPYPKNPAGPLRVVGQAERYNAVALKIMKRQGVAVNDLYTLVLPRLQELQPPKNVHFKPEGSRVMAVQVGECILEAFR